MPTQKTNRKNISIEIRLSGEDFPTHREMVLRWELEEQIERLGIGTIGGSGAGGGRMDFSFEVENIHAVDTAIERVKQLLQEYGALERANITVDDVYDLVCEETPDFYPGECLSFRFEDLDYGAMIVLSTSNEELQTDETLILVGVLDYKDSKIPSMQMFEEKNWLIATSKWREGKPYTVWLHCYGNLEVIRMGKLTLGANVSSVNKFYLLWENIPEYFIREKSRNTDEQN